MNLEDIVADLAQRLEHRFYGKYRGFVVDNVDPQHLGRLKLRVPSVLGKDVITGWSMPCVPYGGSANMGFLFIPEKDSGVWVEFEEGDLEFPIWVGTFWSLPDGESELPKPNASDGAEEDSEQDPPTRKIIKTLKGHTIQFEDKDGEEMIVINQVVDQDKHNVITLDKKGIKINQVINKDGGKENAITLDEKGIEIQHAIETSKHNLVTMDEKGIVITDGVTSGNKIVMSSEGLIIESGKDVKIKGQKIVIEAKAKFTLIGKPIHLNP